jgi:hypothetical protein
LKEEQDEIERLEQNRLAHIRAEQEEFDRQHRQREKEILF